MEKVHADYMHDCAVKLCEYLIKECSILIEMTDFIGDCEEICNRISATEYDADSIMHTLSYYFKDNNLADDDGANMFFDVIKSLEYSTDVVEELAKTVYRYNYTNIDEKFVNCSGLALRAAKDTLKLVTTVHDDSSVGVLAKEIKKLDQYKIDFMRDYDHMIRDLFTSDMDPVEIIKTHNVIDAFKNVFLSFEQISDTAFTLLINSNNYFN